MFPFLYLLTVLCCGASGHPTATSPIPAPEQLQQDPKPSLTEQNPSDTPPQQPTATANHARCARDATTAKTSRQAEKGHHQ